MNAENEHMAKHVASITYKLPSHETFIVKINMFTFYTSFKFIKIRVF